MRRGAGRVGERVDEDAKTLGLRSERAEENLPYHHARRANNLARGSSGQSRGVARAPCRLRSPRQAPAAEAPTAVGTFRARRVCARAEPRAAGADTPAAGGA